MTRPLSVCLLATLGSLAIFGETRPSAQGQGNAFGQVEVSPAVRHDRSRPLRDVPGRPRATTRQDFEVKREAAADTGAPDPAVQSLAVAAMAATQTPGFDGVGQGVYGFNVSSAPPDTVGEAGKWHSSSG